MKNKTVLALLVFIILLVVAYLVQEDPYKPIDKPDLPKIPEIATDKIDKVEIVNGKEAITFDKRGDKWWSSKPKEYLIEDSFKKMVIDKLSDIEIDRKVSNNKDKHDKFEVGADGSRVRLYSQGQQQLSLVVGKATPDYKATFVRLADDDAIYATKASVSGGLKRSLKDWREKKIFSGITKDIISKINFSKGKKSFSLEKSTAPEAGEKAEQPTTAEWKLSGDTGFTADTGRISSVISTFINLRWQSIEEEPEDLKTYGLQSTKNWFSLETEEGKEYKILLGDIDKEKATAWIMVDGKPKVYKISKYQHDKFSKDREYFNKEK